METTIRFTQVFDDIIGAVTADKKLIVCYGGSS